LTGLTRFFACLLVVAAGATIGGVLFWVLHGGTTITRSIAYFFWIAAALTLVGLSGAASRLVARRFDLPFIESWVFIAAAVAMTGIGIVVDVLGS
jgi:hypothetical protein